MISYPVGVIIWQGLEGIFYLGGGGCQLGPLLSSLSQLPTQLGGGFKGVAVEGIFFPLEFPRATGEKFMPMEKQTMNFQCMAYYRESTVPQRRVWLLRVENLCVK